MKYIIMGDYIMYLLIFIYYIIGILVIGIGIYIGIELSIYLCIINVQCNIMRKLIHCTYFLARFKILLYLYIL